MKKLPKMWEYKMQRLYNFSVFLLICVVMSCGGMHKSIELKNKLRYSQLSPKGGYLFVRTDDGLEVYDTKKNKLIIKKKYDSLSWAMSINQHKEGVFAICYEDNINQGYGATLYNIAKNIKKKFMISIVDSIDFLSEGSLWSAFSPDQTEIYLWDIETNKAVNTDKLVFSNKIVGYKFEKNGRIILLRFENDGTYIYHVKNDSLIKVSNNGASRCYTFSPDQTLIVIADNINLKIFVYDVEKGEIIAELDRLDHTIKMLNFTEQGHVIFSYDHQEYIIWNFKNNKRISWFSENGLNDNVFLYFHNDILVGANHPSGSKLYVHNFYDQESIIMEDVSYVYFNHDKTHCIIRLQSGGTVLFDIKTYQTKLTTVDGYGQFSPCGNYAFLKGEDELFIYDIKNEKIVLQHAAQGFRVLGNNKIIICMPEGEYIIYDWINKKKALPHARTGTGFYYGTMNDSFITLCYDYEIRIIDLSELDWGDCFDENENEKTIKDVQEIDF